MNEVLVPMSRVELSDQIINMRVKIACHTGAETPLAWVQRAKRLEDIAEAVLPATPKLTELLDVMTVLRLDLQRIRQDLRALDVGAQYGPGFLALTRTCLTLMEDEARISSQIEAILGVEAVMPVQN